MQSALLQLDDVAGVSVAVTEIVVRVEERVAELVESPAVELVRSALGDELDLRRALSAGIGASGGGGHAQFVERVNGRIDVAEESVAGFEQVVLRVHALD